MGERKKNAVALEVTMSARRITTTTTNPNRFGGGGGGRRRGMGGGGHIIGVSALRSRGIFAPATKTPNEYGGPPQPLTTKAPSRRSTANSEEGECFPALVTVEQVENATKINISVVDFPGLLRVVAWVLNGLELVVERAEISTTDGMASQEFYVTDLKGNKVDTREPSARGSRSSFSTAFQTRKLSKHRSLPKGESSLTMRKMKTLLSFRLTVRRRIVQACF